MICDTALKYFPADFDTELIYQRNGGMTRSTCLDAYSEGYNYSVIAGHGDAFRISTGDGNPPTSSLRTSTRFTARAGAASPMPSIATTPPSTWTACSGIWSLAPSGGNSAVYATTRYDFPNVGQYFLNEFLDFVFWRDVTRLGDACALHNATFIPSALDHDGAVRWTMLTYILLGDPVARLWNSEPDTLAVADAGTMLLSDSLYTLQVTSGGLPVNGAVVTLLGDRGEYGASYTDAAGQSGWWSSVAPFFRPRVRAVVRRWCHGRRLPARGDTLTTMQAGGRSERPGSPRCGPAVRRRPRMSRRRAPCPRLLPSPAAPRGRGWPARSRTCRRRARGSRRSASPPRWPRGPSGRGPASRQECLRGPHTRAGRRVVRHVRADREDDPVAGATRREQSAQACSCLDRPPPGPGRDRKRHDPRPGGRGGQQRQLDLERVLAAV